MGGALPAPGQPGVSTLRVRVLAAYNLVNRDTGLFGDVSDPYVVVRVGQTAQKTPCIDNDLNPVWEQGNEFSFPVSGSVGAVELEVFNSNVIKDDSLGRTGVALWQLPPGQPLRRRQKLEGVSTGELEFEVRFSQGWDGGATGPVQQREQELEYQLGPSVQQPRAWAMPLEGVRVLELSRRTWAAALCGRMLAASGADVVRVAFGEEVMSVQKKSTPGARAKAVSEDDSRNTVDKARPNLVPRKLHAGKRLAPHNVEDPQELAMLKAELLPGCDLLITDLPADELDRMQLGHNAVRKQFPGLIVVHTSSVGILADRQQPGVDDAGAFYCLTGLAEQLGHHLGPTGFAAAAAASALFGMACLAVMRRRCGSQGDRVELSVFRAGRWCMAFGALTGWARPPQPDRRFNREQDWNCAVPALPFDLEGAAHLAPAAGARNSAKLEPLHLRWRNCEAPLRMPTPSQSPVSSELPLARISVIEISDEYHISASAIGSMLADLGARVTKIERPSRPDPWQRTCPQLYKELNSKKTVKVMNYTDLGGATKNGEILDGQAALYRSLADTTIFLTNLPLLALETWGYNVQRLRTMFPHLIIVQVSTWGIDAAGRAREMEGGRKGGQEVHAFWEASGLSSRCFANLSMPPGLSELTCAQHALAGIGLALLRQQRTGGGQLVHVGRYQAGLFCRGVSEVEPLAPLASPLLELQEGRFVRLLGRGGRPHDAWMLLQAVGKRGSLWDKGGKSREGVRRLLERYTPEQIRKDREELVQCVRTWSYDDLCKAFQDQGIDWFVEELRPVDAEAVHKKRAAEAVELKARYQDAVERALQEREKSEMLEASVKDSKVNEQTSIHQEHERAINEAREKQRKQQEAERRMALLQQQYAQGVAPDVTVTVQRAQGLHSVSKGERPDSYCVVQVIDKAFSCFRTPEVLDDSNPEWQFSHFLNGFFYGDTIMFVVYNKDPDPPEVKAVPDEQHTSMLYVVVHGAYNLKNLDTGVMGDVSDPYVQVKVGDVKQKTPTINNNLNPVWMDNNEFSFRVPDFATLDLEVFNSNYVKDQTLGKFQIEDMRGLQREQWQKFRVPLKDGEGAEIEFEAFYKPAEPCKPHQHTDELLGRAVLEAGSFYPNGFEGPLRLGMANHDTGSALWVSVQVEPGGTVGGTIPGSKDGPGASSASGVGSQAAGRGQQPAGPSRLPSGQTVLPGQTGMAGRQPGSVGSSASPGGNAMQTARNVPPLGSYAQPQDSGTNQPGGGGGGGPFGQLQVRVTGATNLKNLDTGLMGDVSDPYIVVRLGRQEKKTPTINDNLNPEWSDGNLFSFRFEQKDTLLQLQAMNANTFKDDSLGIAEIDLTSLPQGQWLQLREPLVGCNQGEVEFDVFLQLRDDSPAGQSQSRGSFSQGMGGGNSPQGGMMAQLQGTWVIDGQHYATVDPQGRVLYNGQHMGPSHDLFEQNGVVQRGDGWTLDVQRSTPALTIFAKQGEGSIQWQRYQGPPLSNMGGTPLGSQPPGSAYGAQSMGGPSRGSQGQFGGAAGGQPGGGYAASGVGSPASAGYQGPASTLHVRVTGALNLINKDTGLFGDVSDPYVSVQLGNTEFKTPTINNDLNPVWEADNMFSFNIDLQDAVLNFKVMNSNVVKDDCLGTASVDLRTIQPGQWCHFRERLVDGDKGEIEFDVYLQLAEFHRLIMEYTSLLYVRVNGALRLKNLDTGILGDVSDPYVSVRIGQGQEQRTPTIMNNLNPVWEDGNQFTFQVKDGDEELMLEVFNSNYRKDDSLGFATVPLHSIDPNRWCRFQEKLERGAGAEVEFDAYFKPTEHYRLMGELRKARESEQKLGAEAAKLGKEVQLADYAVQWLADVSGNTKMPMSVEERDWEHACGGRNLVIPAWIAVTSTQIDALRQRQQPKPVALFPDAVAGDKKAVKLRVKMLSAEGLCSVTLGDVPNAYCTCEVPLKPRSLIRSRPALGTPSPEWNHTQTVKDYTPGDALIFEVYCADTEDVYNEEGEERQARRKPAKTGELLGRAWLKGEQVYPNGFDGLLSLFLGPRNTEASLRIMAVCEEAE